ncbi:MAG: hypothetical protein K0S47_2950 [Herbinix sp.]|jgi:hypothetical protein|nr:hypothetical protein [Herbinix sp.]
MEVRKASPKHTMKEIVTNYRFDKIINVLYEIVQLNKITK